MCVEISEGRPPGWQGEVLLEPEEMTNAKLTAVFHSVASAILPPLQRRPHKETRGIFTKCQLDHHPHNLSRPSMLWDKNQCPPMA